VDGGEWWVIFVNCVGKLGEMWVNVVVNPRNPRGLVNMGEWGRFVCV
jgi:hypothetical protein